MRSPAVIVGRVSGASSHPGVEDVAAGMQNFRDLGGIPVSTGGRIRAGVLYRSDAPRAGDAAPPTVWPPANVVDLRSAEEVGGTHPLAQEASAVYTIVRVAGRPRTEEASLEDLYRRAIRGIGPRVADIARIVIESDGPTLVHCTVGKDRTGLVVAAILSAVGVDDTEVVADYTVTETNMPAVLARLAAGDGLDAGAALVERLARDHPEVLAAPPVAIAAALEALDAYGGAARWLLAHGLDQDGVRRLRERLVEA